jgi:hypothetical protein
MANKHRQLIKAWADGAVIEYQCDLTGAWLTATTPSWDETTEYRIASFENRIKLADGYWLDSEVLDACLWWHTEDGPQKVYSGKHLDNIKEFPNLYSKREPRTEIVYTGQYYGPEIVV